jgi:hypothetical protein
MPQSNYFEPRSHSETVTNAWDLKNIPQGVHRVKFITADGVVLVRINASGSNYFVVTTTTSAFDIDFRKGMEVEMRGQNGGETVYMYLS